MLKKVSILEGFTRMMKIKGDYVTIEELRINFLSNEVVLTNKQFEILSRKLY